MDLNTLKELKETCKIFSDHSTTTMLYKLIEREINKAIVTPCLIAKDNLMADGIEILTKNKKYECLLKRDSMYCIIDNTLEIEVVHEDYFK